MPGAPTSSDYSRVLWGQIWGQLLYHETGSLLLINQRRLDFDSAHNHIIRKMPC
jgi:hypothetical protein